MRNKYVLKQFIAFLKKNNAYNEYMQSLINHKTYRSLNPIDFLIKHVKSRPANMISGAFDWDEGYKLNREEWYKLHQKWFNYVVNL